MSWKIVKDMKDALTKKQRLIILKEFNIIEPALLAICVVFLQNLITVEKPDQYQTNSIIAFSIALPLLAIHFFSVQTIDKPNTPVPAYLAKSFEYLFGIGLVSTVLGVTNILINASRIAALAFLVSSSIAVIVISVIYYYIKVKGINKIEEKEEEIIYD